MKTTSRLVTILSISLVSVILLSGCESLIIKEDDNIASATGKVLSRTLAGVGTLGMSEVGIASIKKEEEARPRIVTSGSRNKRIMTTGDDKPLTVIVWGNNQAAVGQMTDALQQLGDTVIDRGRLRSLTGEQTTKWTYTSEDTADLLRLAKQVGADIIVFAQFNGQSQVQTGTYNTPGLIMPVGNMYAVAAPSSRAYSQELHHMRVNVQAVNADDGAMRWNGSATFDKPISNPDAAIGILTQAAFARAVCPNDDKHKWVEQEPWRRAGCVPVD